MILLLVLELVYQSGVNKPFDTCVDMRGCQFQQSNHEVRIQMITDWWLLKPSHITQMHRYSKSIRLIFALLGYKMRDTRNKGGVKACEPNGKNKMDGWCWWSNPHPHRYKSISSRAPSDLHLWESPQRGSRAGEEGEINWQITSCQQPPFKCLRVP